MFEGLNTCRMSPTVYLSEQTHNGKAKCKLINVYVYILDEAKLPSRFISPALQKNKQTFFNKLPGTLYGFSKDGFSNKM